MLMMGIPTYLIRKFKLPLKKLKTNACQSYNTNNMALAYSIKKRRRYTLLVKFYTHNVYTYIHVQPVLSSLFTAYPKVQSTMSSQLRVEGSNSCSISICRVITVEKQFLLQIHNRIPYIC